MTAAMQSQNWSNNTASADDVSAPLSLRDDFNRLNARQMLKQQCENLFRHNMEMNVSMGTIDLDKVCIMLNGAVAARAQMEKQEKERREQCTSDVLFQMLLNQLHNFENNLANLYGENFAEDLLADLAEQKLVSKDDYTRIMGIKDQDERRQAIADLIQQGLANGTITAADLANHPWAIDWVGKRQDVKAANNAQANDVETGLTSIHDVTADVANTATDGLVARSDSAAGTADVNQSRFETKNSSQRATEQGLSLGSF